MADPVYTCRHLDTGGGENRRGDVIDVGELFPQTAFVLDPPGPGDHQRVAGAAQVRGHLLDPLKGCGHGPGPAGRVLGVGLGAADDIELGQLHLHGFLQALEGSHVIDTARRATLGTAAIVADDVEKQGIVELAGGFQVVNQFGDLGVGVGQEAGKGFHQACCDLLLIRAEAVPGWNLFGPGRQFGIRGDNAELFLPRQDFLAHGVPALVKAALVAIDPLLRHLQRCVGRARGVIEEEGLVRGEAVLQVEPLDGRATHILGEVVVLHSRMLDR